jgi:hypothetical protein
VVAGLGFEPTTCGRSRRRSAREKCQPGKLGNERGRSAGGKEWLRGSDLSRPPAAADERRREGNVSPASWGISGEGVQKGRSGCGGRI